MFVKLELFVYNFICEHAKKVAFEGTKHDRLHPQNLIKFDLSLLLTSVFYLSD